MALITTLVIGYLYNAKGEPIANTPVTFRLTKAERDENVIVPETLIVNTDDEGLLSVPLWPNTRGTQGSQYRMTLKEYGGAGERRLYDQLLTVPETSTVLLVDIFDTGAPDTTHVSTAIRESASAEASALLATIKADAAAASAASVAGTAAAAAQAALDAQSYATAAELSSTTSTTNANAAGNSANAATAASVEAQGHATTAQSYIAGSQSAAVASSNSAADSADSAAAALGYSNQAGANAAAGAVNASAASGFANNAAASAAAAVVTANSAVATLAAVQTAATNASNSALDSYNYSVNAANSADTANSYLGDAAAALAAAQAAAAAAAASANDAEIANGVGSGTGGPASGDRVSVVYGPHPYWRVAAASVEDRYLVCTGLEFTNIADGANVAVGGTPMSSGVFGSNVAANAFDGDDGTFWEGNATEINGAANKWIGYHFTTPVEITEVRWTNDADAEPAESLRYGLVQFSNDGVRWFTAWDFTVDTWGAGVTTEVTRPLPLLVAAAGGNGIIPLGYAPIREWDLSRGYMFKMTIEGDTVLNLPSNLRPGSWVMYVKQDAVGGHRMDFQAGYYGPRGLLPVLSTLPNAVDILTFTSDGEHLAVSIQANLALA